MIGSARRRVGDLVANSALKLAMATDGRKRWRTMLEQTANPAQVQQAVLTKILATNAGCEFGRLHRFGAIDNSDSYRNAVAVQDYESLRRYIEAQETTGDGLTAEQPILYARTSGTTGEPKDIPVTESTVARLSATQRLYSYGLNRSTDAFAGKVLGIGGAAIEGHRPSGKPFGSATGLIYQQMPSVVRSKYVLPAEALGIEDYETKYRIIAALSMAQPNLTSIATANPSTVARLIQVMGRDWELLTRAVATGSSDDLGALTTAQQQAVTQSMVADPDRARQLDRIWSADEGHVGGIWPNLAALVVWTGGSCGFAIDGLKPQLSPTTEVVEYGYSASEFRGTIGVDGTSFAVPTIWDNFFEFVARDDWEAGREHFVDIERLVEGEQYYLFVTTPDGLYRYNMNDVMLAGPRFQQTPTLAFVRKGRGTTNITGEKVTEEQILRAVATGAKQLGVRVDFFVAVADTGESRYRVLVELSNADSSVEPGAVEALGQHVEKVLAETNVEYKAKRDSGRLEAVAGLALKSGAGAAYRRALVDGGQRDAQFKHLHLQPAEDLRFDFKAQGLLR